MKKTTKTYRLPNGEITKSVRKYVKTWRKLSKDVCKALGPGYKVFAFDPNLAVSRPNKNENSFTVDTDVALTIQRLINPDFMDKFKIELTKEQAWRLIADLREAALFLSKDDEVLSDISEELLVELREWLSGQRQPQ